MWKFSRRCTIMFRTGPLGEKARKGEVFMRKTIAILLTVSLLALMLCAAGAWLLFSTIKDKRGE